MFVYAGKARVEKNLYVGKIFSGKGIHRLFALEEWFFCPPPCFSSTPSALASLMHLLIKSLYV